MDELEALLWEFESAGIRANTLNVSLTFWKQLNSDKHIRLTPTGEIYYRYLFVNVNPKQESNFEIY